MRDLLACLSDLDGYGKILQVRSVGSVNESCGPLFSDRRLQWQSELIALSVIDCSLSHVLDPNLMRKWKTNNFQPVK